MPNRFEKFLLGSGLKTHIERETIDMARVKDNWFTQDDIKSIFDNHNEFQSEWATIYENRDSAIENYVYYSIPIKPNVINKIIKYVSWSSYDEVSRKKVLYINGKHFLSRSFRQHFDIFMFGDEYSTKSQKIYAKVEYSDDGGTKVKKCLVLTEALVTYLKSTNQLLLYGIRSHRYSERSLLEFGLEKSEKEFKSDRKNYIYKLQGISNREQNDRPRAKSMSIVLGKYIVVKTYNALTETVPQ